MLQTVTKTFPFSSGTKGVNWVNLPWLDTRTIDHILVNQSDLILRFHRNEPLSLLWYCNEELKLQMVQQLPFELDPHKALLGTQTTLYWTHWSFTPQSHVLSYWATDWLKISSLSVSYGPSDHHPTSHRIRTMQDQECYPMKQWQAAMELGFQLPTFQSLDNPLNLLSCGRPSFFWRFSR